VVPLVFWFGNRKWGLSSSLDHICAAVIPARPPSLRYDWRRAGGWHLAMVAGVLVGAWVAANWLSPPDASVAISSATAADLRALGLSDLTGLFPREVFSWAALLSVPGLLLLVLGGFLVGFGARYAKGCTSGHAISGLATLNLSSLIAVLGFFVGGLIAANLLLPRIL
jgi:uncharacterized membrane protein YedE/YeeE